MKWNVVFAAFFCAASISAKTRIISPAPGTWGNKQVLAIESDEESIYYSVDGRDPARFGFAYDCPVLINKTGDVELRVSTGKYGAINERKTETIRYTVDEMPSENAFLTDVIKTGFVDCMAGETLNIPSGCRGGIGGVELKQGDSIFCAKENILENTSRITIDGEGGHYSFVLRILPSDEGETPRYASLLGDPDIDLDEDWEYSGEEKRPWSMAGWKNIMLNDPKYIYRIDGGMWVGRQTVPIEIDRATRHTIDWQSIAFKKGNEVKSLDLLPIPHLYTSVGERGDTTITVKDSGYKIGVMTKSGLRLRDSVLLDTINGGEASGTFSVKMYYMGVYQGSIAIPYSIDRCPPAMPVIESAVAAGATSRTDVDLTVTGEKGSALYVSVDDGDWEKTYVDDSEDAAPSRMMTLKGDIEAEANGAATEHTVRAYSVDKGNNHSPTAQYSVTIDKYRYYVDEVNGKRGAFGNSEDPTASIEDCLMADTARITVRGTVHIGQEALRCIQDNMNDLMIEGAKGDEHLVIDGTLLVQGKLTLKNLIVVRDVGAVTEGDSPSLRARSAKAGDTPMQPLKTGETAGALIVCRGGTVALDGCGAFVDCGQSGAVIHCNSGAVNIKNSNLTSVARVRTAAIMASGSNVQIRGTHISCLAMESVCVSCVGGRVLVEGSVLSVKGERAHGVELFSTKSRITGNTLEANLTSGGKSIYCDAHNQALEHDGNVERGWGRGSQ